MMKFLFCIFVFVSSSLLAWGQNGGLTIGHPTLLSPHSDPIAIHGSKVFVVNTPSDTLDVIDAATDRVVTRIPTGIDPVSVCLRPDGKEIWVSNHISDSVSVIDNVPESASYLSVIATIQDIDLEKKTTRFNEPVDIAFASNRKAYVALSSSNEIAVVDVKSRKVTKRLKIRAQEPRAIAVRKGKLFVLPFESNNQTQLSGGKKEDIDGTLVTFDAQKLAGSFDSAGFTVDVVKNPKIPDRDLFVFDTETDELIETVDSLGTNLFGLAVDDSGNVFVANTDARNHANGRAGTKKHGLKELQNRPYLNQITKVSGDRKPAFFHLNPLPPEQPARKNAVATPFGISVSGDNQTLYVTGASSDHLVTMDARSGDVLGRVRVGAVPRGVALQEPGKIAWVFNAVANTVSKVDVSLAEKPTVTKTIPLSDPTPEIYKKGRIAFNTARASSNGTFSCASCHADGHTDQLLWVLDTPHIVGADQIEPRLSQTLRGLRGTAPYHWDGVPGDPYGGPNASTRDRLPPNSDINIPESSVRSVIDGSMASTMLAHDADIENDEGNKGYLSKAERDAMAIFLLNLSHMPARGRAYSDILSQKALTGIERFHITGARDTKALNTNVCGSCHTLPYLATDQDSMNVPSFRGALDRFITQAQGRNSVIDLGGVKQLAEDGFPEEEVWRRMLNMGEHKRLWPVLDMFKESSMGFSGAFGRQATLSQATAKDPMTRDLIEALERSAGQESVVLHVTGRFHQDGSSRDVRLQFADGAYQTSGGDQSWSRAQLVAFASEGEFVATFTGHHGVDVTSAPPAIWTAGVLHKQRGAQLFPRVHEEKPSMVISALHIQDGATLLVDGRKVSGTIVDVGKDLVEVQFGELPAKGMRMLQVQNPNSYLSNEFIFFVETREEAVARYKKEPDYLLTTILNSALINDHPEETRIVIEAGADLNMPHGENHFDKERAPIIIAAQYGRTALVEELLGRGADPNIRTKDGDTALHRAAHMGRLEICQMLIAAGADPSARDKRDKRPIDLLGHFRREGNFEKYHAPWNVNLTLDHERYLRDSPGIRRLLESAAAADRPNVVILLADDLGSKDIGCYGGPVKTPTLDALAAQGVRFTDFHAGAPVCSPSRATLLTGRQHLRTGVYTVIQDHAHDMHLLDREVTIAELLKENGYQTAHLGKWHVGAPFRGRDKPTLNDHGFDYWFATDNNAHPSHENPSNFFRNGEKVGEIEGYACQIVADEAITWLEKERKPDQPFLLNIWFHEPHDPIAAPDEIVSQYGDLDDPAAVYSATIDNTDRAIARVLNKLKEIGELDDTLIVYTSDHGSYRAERNGDLRGEKGSHFEGGLRTPGIFYWPKGIPGGRVETQAAGSVDLLPTLCGLVRIPRPSGVLLDGADLAPLLTTSGKFRRHQPLFWHWPIGQPSVAMREGNFTLMGYRAQEFERDTKRIAELLRQVEPMIEKDLGREIERRELFSLLFNSSFKSREVERLRTEFVRLNQFQETWTPAIKSGSGGFRKFELYDLASDPNQQNDLASSKPEVVERMKSRLLEINASVLADAPTWVASDTEKLLARIDSNELPEAYLAGEHQKYVDKRMEGMSNEQRARLGQLWKEKQRLDPDMENRGWSFVRILEFAATEN
jgi:YVTN family beta-propeller protein